MMEYVKLGLSDLNVSRICLGCMGFGDPTIGQHSWTIGEESTREIIRRSLDLGVNFFDTAIAYQLGTSEQYVGRALRDMARREDKVVATKFLPRTDEEIQQGVDGRQHVLNSIDSSLSHLGMDYVDLYIYHIWDYKTPAEEILDGMNEAVRQGKARYIGIANAYAYLLKDKEQAKHYYTQFLDLAPQGGEANGTTRRDDEEGRGSTEILRLPD